MVGGIRSRWQRITNLLLLWETQTDFYSVLSSFWSTHITSIPFCSPFALCVTLLKKIVLLLTGIYNQDTCIRHPLIIIFLYFLSYVSHFLVTDSLTAHFNDQNSSITKDKQAEGKRHCVDTCISLSHFKIGCILFIWWRPFTPFVTTCHLNFS